jgi:co-chaperonin GroES (HSP10)
MQAIGKYIIISKIEEQVETKSGLLLSSEDMKGMRYGRGTVINVGGDVNVIKDGDDIYYSKNRAYTMVIEDEPYTVITEGDVVVVA